MNTLNRSGFRNFWLAALLLLIGGALVSFHYAGNARDAIGDQTLALNDAYRELDNAKRLSATLTELDAQTISEATATRLEILRHLGLERTDYRIDINARQEKQVGTTTLYLRNVQISADLSYPLLLSLADRLHNTGRLVINQIVLDNTTREDRTPDMAHMMLVGTLYGLQKKAVAPQAEPGT